MDGMADLAAAVVKELRAGDGDLDTYVIFSQKQIKNRYKLQPTVRNGALKWAWHGKWLMQAPPFKLVLDDLDDVIAFIHTEFGTGGACFAEPEHDRYRGTTPKVRLEIWSDKAGLIFHYDIKPTTLYYDNEFEDADVRPTPKDKLKQFLMRCPKIELTPDPPTVEYCLDTHINRAA